MGNILAPLTFTVGLLLFLKFEIISGRSRSIESQSKSDCMHGDCPKREYPWIEALYKKHDPFTLYNKLDQRKLLQSYFDYLPASEISNVPNDNILIENKEQKMTSDPEILTMSKYFQDQSLGVPQTWQENDNNMVEDNVVNGGDILDDSLNNSQIKRAYHHGGNDFDSFLTLARLGKNFTLENLKHTRGHASSSDDKFTSVERVSCSCQYKKETLDLGNHYFPRLHVTYQCVSNTCSLPSYSCKGRLYKIWVLKKREDDDVVGERTISILPEDFKKDYFLKELWIPVACECTT